MVIKKCITQSCPEEHITIQGALKMLIPPFSFLLNQPLNHPWDTDKSVQFSSVTLSCPTLCNHMDCSMPGLPVHYQLPEFTQTHVHWVSDAIQSSHPLSSFSSRLQSFPASVFSNESVLCIRWPQYWSFSFSTHLQILFKLEEFFWLYWQGCCGYKKILN